MKSESTFAHRNNVMSKMYPQDLNCFKLEVDAYRGTEQRASEAWSLFVVA